MHWFDDDNLTVYTFLNENVCKGFLPYLACTWWWLIDKPKCCTSDNKHCSVWLWVMVFLFIFHTGIKTRCLIEPWKEKTWVCCIYKQEPVHECYTVMSNKVQMMQVRKYCLKMTLWGCILIYFIILKYIWIFLLLSKFEWRTRCLHTSWSD